MENFRFEMTKVYSEILPPQVENFRFEMTKVYPKIPPPPKWKTSDLRWPKFTLKYLPSPMENFRFEMNEVYSEIPPPPKKKLLVGVSVCFCICNKCKVDTQDTQTWHNEVLNKFYTLKHGFYYCSTSKETKCELQVKDYKVLRPVNL